MGDGPFGCFEPLGPGVAPSALNLLGLGEAESLYRVFFEVRGWGPRQVDECELWELAVMLGKARSETGSGRVLTGRALLRARVEAAREGRPPPSIALVPTDMPEEVGE